MKRPVANKIPLRIVTRDAGKSSERAIPGETPVALTYNGLSHVVLMATPADLEELALGFTLSEEIAGSKEEVSGIEIFEADQGFIAKIEIPKARLEGLIKRPRNLVGQTGCGLCGVEDLEAAVRTYAPIETEPVITKDAVFKALQGLPERQPLNRETGAVHAAAFCTAAGAVEDVFEDVGRHNAFDKLIGHRARSGKGFGDGFVLLTSRCSFELVQKALAMGIPALVTISAPTALAADLAKNHRLTLVSLARADSILVVNDPWRVFDSEIQG